MPKKLIPLCSFLAVCLLAEACAPSGERIPSPVSESYEEAAASSSESTLPESVPCEEGTVSPPESSVPESESSAEETAFPEETLRPDEYAWEDETFAPRVLDEAGRSRVYDLTDSVSAWIPMPEGFYADETFSSRNALILYAMDTEPLHAHIAYYVYDTEDGYLDFNMDDPLEEEAEILSADEELTVEGPSSAVTFSLGEQEMRGASLFVSYLPAHSAPVYTWKYLLWTHLDERTIVTCQVGLSSDSPEPELSMEEAAGMFLAPVTGS